MDRDYWLWPLPPAGRLRVVCQWLDQGIDLNAQDLDAELFLQAAAARTTGVAARLVQEMANMTVWEWPRRVLPSAPGLVGRTPTLAVAATVPALTTTLERSSLMFPRIVLAAAACAMATTAVVAAAPASAAGAIQFGKVQYDSPGSDTGSNTSLNSEYIVIKNTGTTTRALTGWTVRDAVNHVYTFGTFALGAGKTVTLRTGSGTNSSGTRYWRSGYYIWNNTGDEAYLRNAVGTGIDYCAWTSTGTGYKYC